MQNLPQFLRHRLQNRTNLAKVVGNIGWLFVDRIFQMAVGLIVGVWVARYLGPAQYGVLAYTFALGALVFPLSLLGLSTVAVQELVSKPDRKHETLGTAFVLQELAGLIAGFCMIGVAWWQNGVGSIELWLVTVAAISYLFRVPAIDYWFQAQVQSKYTVWAMNAAVLTGAVVKIVVILLGAPIIVFAWIFTFEALLKMVFLVYAYRLTQESIWQWRFRWRTAAELLEQGWPLLLSGLAIIVYMKIDQVMLKSIAGDYAVGIYSVAVRLSEMWYFIPGALMVSVFPSLIRAKQVDPDFFNYRIQQALDLLVLVSVGVALPLTFVAEPLITLLFGAEFVEAGLILAIHIWAAVFVFIGVAQTRWLIVEGMNGFVMRQTVIGMVANIGLNLLLIPLYSGLGAAIATVISYAAAGWLANATHRRTWPLFKMQVSSLLMVPAAYRLWRLVRSSKPHNVNTDNT
ncbi:MAG: flippase [Okeania sp. SIO3B3]|nr:flippase [Okeania sp. SIO3B3]